MELKINLQFDVYCQYSIVKYCYYLVINKYVY